MTFLLLLFFLLAPMETEAATSPSLAGRILIDVERHGEAWYIDPLTMERVYLGHPDDALTIMRAYGLGISNADLEQIPTVGSTESSEIVDRLAGRILLAVESRGEAWYIDPVSKTRVYLGRPTDAYAIMQSYGLGALPEHIVAFPVADDVTVIHDVTFVSQAPFGEWGDPRQADGCEETSAIMAVAWARGETLTQQSAKELITSMSDWEKEKYGSYIDTSAHDTLHWLVQEYLQFYGGELKTGITVDDIRESLQDGNIVILPAAGKLLSSKYPNLPRHTVLVVGYEAETQTFILHDPGTRLGAHNRISAIKLQNALMDYHSGDHVAIGNLPDAMVTIPPLR